MKLAAASPHLAIHVRRRRGRLLARPTQRFDLAAARQQYYPRLHSAFWIEHRLWADAALANVAQHALPAW